MSRPWIPKTFKQVCKRAAGRRQYHAQRRRERDRRQLIIMGVLVKLGWPRYGIGRMLAKDLLVDPATISRDLSYIRKWRASVISNSNGSAVFADAIIQRFVTAGIHPRRGYSWTYTYNKGVVSLRVQRGYAYSFGDRRLLKWKQNAKTTS